MEQFSIRSSATNAEPPAQLPTLLKSLKQHHHASSAAHLSCEGKPQPSPHVPHLHRHHRIRGCCSTLFGAKVLAEKGAGKDDTAAPLSPSPERSSGPASPTPEVAHTAAAAKKSESSSPCSQDNKDGTYSSSQSPEGSSSGVVKGQELVRRGGRRGSALNLVDLTREKLMLREFKFFRKLPVKVQTVFCNVVQLASKPTGSVLFQQGDPPGDCYIILSGAVGIFIASQDSASDSNEGETAEDESADMEESGWAKYGTQVAVLGPGSLFGEVSIIKGQPRNATCLCTEDTKLLFVSLADFERVLKRDMMVVKDDKMQWLEKHVPGVVGLPEQKLEYLAHNFKSKSYPQGHVLIHQGAISEPMVYLVCKGAVDIRCRTFQDAVKTKYVSTAKRLSVVVEGGLFGTVSAGAPEPFMCVVSETPCTILEARGGDFARLPVSVRQALQGHLGRSARWHSESSHAGVVVPAASHRSSHVKGAKKVQPTTIKLRDYGRQRQLHKECGQSMVPLAATGISSRAIQEMKRAASMPTVMESNKANHSSVAGIRPRSSCVRLEKMSVTWSNVNTFSVRLPPVDMRVDLF